MNSGIYKLTFSDNSIYIGKSVDIDKRWNQHIKALNKGTHTKAIQDAFNRCGLPKFEVIFDCHPDHIDILETYFINGYWCDGILNTTLPADIDDLGKEILLTYPDYVWDMSTFEHIQKWFSLVTELEKVTDKLEKSHNADFLNIIQESNAELIKEVNRLRNRGFFARILNR